MEGPGECRRRRGRPVAESRQPVEQQVDLELRPAGVRLAGDRRPVEERVEHLRRARGIEHRTAEGAARRLDGPVAGIDAGDLDARSDLGSRRGRRLVERTRHRAHPADRDVPVAGSAADHVVQEADVLAQGRIVEVGEGADESVGGGDPADQVVVEVLTEQRTQRQRGERLPQFGGRRVGGGLAWADDEVVHVGGGPQRLGHGREDAVGDHAEPTVERLPRGEAEVGAGHPPERRGRRIVIEVVDEDAARRIRRQGRVRRIAASDECDVEVEVGDDLARHQRDQVRIPRQARGETGERRRRHRGAADVVGLLEDEHTPAGTSEVGGSREAVVSRAHHDVVVRRVVSGAHRSSVPDRPAAQDVVVDIS